MACAVAICAAGCGKKGPPLAPFAKAPAAATEVSARRLGQQVEIRFTVPVRDVDNQRPANIDRVEVWALTGPRVAPDLFLKHATLVATVPVRPPAPPPPDVEEGKPPPPPPPPPPPGLDQGQPGLAVDTLTAETMTPVVIPELEKARAREEEERSRRLAAQGPLRLTPPDVGKPLPPVPARYYVVIGRNGGRRGALSQQLPVPLRTPPPAPPQPTASVAENYLEVAWVAPEGIRQPVHRGTATPSPGSAAPARPRPGQPAAATPAVPEPGVPAAPPTPDDEVDDIDALDARAEGLAPDVPEAEAPDPATPGPAAPAPAEPVAGQPPAAEATGTQPGSGPTAGLLNSRTLTGFPSVSTTYAVYEVPPPQQQAPAPLQPGEVPALPRRLTQTPIAVTSWRDSRVEFGSERCFVVRTVETWAGAPIESEPSPPVCVSPADTFPPKAPANLAAVASEGAISLIWEANTEPDLAGYIVLRGEAPGDTLRPLMSEPIKETTFRDTTTRRGVRYVYAIVAVDAASPQNVSTQSNRVEETAR